jgi:uncharacterized protein YeaO (DUF488 family)
MARSKRDVRVRRVYDAPDPSDGARVLVDRIWPRGMAKERAALDEWAREIAPSGELRRWYGHDPEHYEDFAARYRAELAEPEPAAALERLHERAAAGALTLLTATKSVEHSHATVLAGLLRSRR